MAAVRAFLIGSVVLAATLALVHLAPTPQPQQQVETSAAGEAEPSAPTQSVEKEAPKPEQKSETATPAVLPPVQTTVAAKDGDTLMDVLLKAGAEKAEASRAIDALKVVYDPKALKIGQPVTVTFLPSSRGAKVMHAVSLEPDARRLVSAHRASDGYAASETKRQETRQLARHAGTIEGSLFETATAQGVPYAILSEMIRAFSYDVDFQRDLQPGDSFEVMFERFVDAKGQAIRDGVLLYASLTLSGEKMPIYRYVDAKGRADYYNQKGESVRKALLRTPVDGARISSGYGMRLHPILGFSTMHKGVDFAVPTGTPVMAAGSGTVETAGRAGAYGNYLRIRHDAHHATAYAHLSRFARGIRPGMHVEQGQTVAFSGETGRATGPHLHYEILVDATQVNPLSVKFQSGTKLAGAELRRFVSDVKTDDTLFANLPVSHKVALAKRNGPARE